MADAKRIVLGGGLFYFLLVGLLLGTTAIHEYSHYVAHEGFGPAPVAFYETPADAREDLVHVETMTIDGRDYRVENVRETTIVFYEDLLVYAFTLNMAPLMLYEDGTLGATYMHTDEAQTASRIHGEGHTGAHWDTVMGAPMMVALFGFVGSLVWLAWGRSVASRAFVAGFASELGNNAHHAAEIGLPGTAYSVITQVLFALALLTAILVSNAYLELMRPLRQAPRTPAGASAAPARSAPRGDLRFSHARARPQSPGVAYAQGMYRDG